MTDFVLVALADAGGRLLLQERDEHAPIAPDMWSLPGGGVEPGETPTEAAVRELAEETGLGGVGLVELARRRVWSVQTGRGHDYALLGALTALTDADVECHEGRGMTFVPPRETGSLPLTGPTLDALPRVLLWDAYVAAHGRRPGTGFASVVLVDAAGRLLLQERDEHARIDPERWGLPGGHLEPGEHPRGGAVRELEEETGVRLAPEALTHLDSFAVYHAVNDAVDTVDVYAARVDLADADVECREGRRIVFVDPREAVGLPLTAAASQVVPAFLSSALYASMAP